VDQHDPDAVEQPEPFSAALRGAFSAQRQSILKGGALRAGRARDRAPTCGGREHEKERPDWYAEHIIREQAGKELPPRAAAPLRVACRTAARS